MVCGVNLGVVVVCLLQVEYVFSLWERQGRTFRKQNVNTHNPFIQNRLRQASFSSGFDQGFSVGSYSEAASALTHNGRSKVQYASSRPKGEVLQKWRLPASAIGSVSTLRTYNPPVGGPQQYRTSGRALQSSETDSFRKPHMTPVDLKDKVQTSATVRGKLVRSSKKLDYNRMGSFPFMPVQVNQYQNGPQRSYSWGLPQSNFNRRTPNDQAASSSVVTYRVPNEFGGSFIMRLRNKDNSEAGPLELQSLPQQTVSYPYQGQMTPKSIWRRVRPQS